MTLALVFQSDRDTEKKPGTAEISVDFTVVALVFAVMLLVMAFSTSAHHGPRDKRFALNPFFFLKYSTWQKHIKLTAGFSDEIWLLKVWC